MESSFDSREAEKYLSRHLEKPVPFQRYAAVKAIILYWEDSDGFEEYAKEADELKDFFQGLQFDTELCKIPVLCGQDSELELHSFILEKQKQLRRQMRDLDEAPCQLIVHYGGHGDKDDDKHATGIGGPQERRSVWRAFHSGGPSLRWYAIQQSFLHIEFDVLLLFDCCYAAQAGRGAGAIRKENLPGRVELLAAAVDQTPRPGDEGSFTKTMIAIMRKRIEQDGHVSISELHRILTHRSSALYTPPFHVNIRQGADERSIVLEKLKEQDDTIKDWRVALDVTIRFRDGFTQARLDDIVRWLRAQAPKAFVAYTDVNRVLENTKQVNDFVESKLPERSGVVAQSLDTSVLEQIDEVWSSLQQLIHKYTTHHSMQNPMGNEDRMEELASSFIKRVDDGYNEILEVIQRAVMMSDLSSDLTMIDKALADPSSRLSGIRSQLRLRRIIYCQERPELRGQITATKSSVPVASARLMEYKTYDQHQSPKDIQNMEARIGLLAEVLASQKPESFRCLQLHEWKHDQDHRRFVYHFSIPDNYSVEPRSLYEAITKLDRQSRPTLGERLTMAYRIAKAVEQWHRVDWVHQSISSHDIFFLKPKSRVSRDRWDFEAPFLHGFDFARPNAKPSVGRYVENIELDMYRHPDRQGETPLGHKKEHDLYSLGVVLLEIGLWRSCRDMVEKRAKDKQKLRKQGVSGDAAGEVERNDMVKWLKGAVQDSLAHHVGSDYRDAVSTCLTSSFGVMHDDERKSKLLDAMDKMVLQKLARRPII
ncbi:protein kinase-like (pk-like) [Stemphylium lycopersici]|nr:protein kinase-like (pk-like) [Stemphylium lycopersici]